jgi:CRP-like cAMP-binding protein
MSKESLQYFKMLQRIPLFRDLDNTSLIRIAGKMIERQLPAGEVIIHQGEPGHEMYIIREGRAVVTGVNPDTGGEVLLAELYAGDFFGEMALLSDAPRTATVATVNSSRLLTLKKEDFLELLDAQPRVYKVIGLILAQRLQQTNELLKQRTAEMINIATRGSIHQHSVLNLLRFAEDHQFTGTIQLASIGKQGIIRMQRGELVDAVLNGESDHGLLHQLLQWEQGQYEMQPEIGGQKETQMPEPAERERYDGALIGVSNMISQYVSSIIGYNATAEIMQLIRRRGQSIDPFFKQLQIDKRGVVAFAGRVQDEQIVAACAFLIAGFLREAEKLVIGMPAIDIHKLTTSYREQLEALSFYEEFEKHYNQAE